MRQLVLDHLVAHWHDSLEVIYERKLSELDNLPDVELFELFLNINEIIC